MVTSQIVAVPCKAVAPEKTIHKPSRLRKLGSSAKKLAPIRLW